MFGATATKDIEMPQGPSDGISCLKFSPKGNYLIAGSWDHKVRCWEIANNQGVPKALISHEAPILCADWSSDGTKVFTGGCDNKVKCWNLPTNQMIQVAQHNEPVKELFWIQESNILVTASWDKTIKYWDTRSPTAAVSVELSDRIYAMDVLHPLLVVGTADRQVYIYNLEKPQVEFKKMESPLKYQTRCISCFPDKTGFALGSIEGRVAIQSLDDKQDLSFTFKCHRENETTAYSVNSISFAQPYGTFATAGSDGGFNFWDKECKHRLKQFPKCNQTISCATFNPEATYYAYAVSYDWSKGSQHFDPNQPNTVNVHPVLESEIKGKGNKPPKRST
eukprot:gene3865-4817_t